MRPRAITVCVELDDIFTITLPHMLPHVEDLLVVTSTSDRATEALCNSHGVKVFRTDAFYEDGAEFNKGRALELGFDVMGRIGWTLIIDCDIVLPADLDLNGLDPGCLWGCRRVFWDDPFSWNGESWHYDPNEVLQDVAGYFQLFHADAAPGRPWYPTNLRSAASCDQHFGWNHFSNNGRYIPDQSVLHLGPPGANWCGRTRPRADGTVPPEADSRRKALDAMVARRITQDPNAETLP